VEMIKSLLQEGLTLHRSGALAEAIARYTEVLRTDPTNADAHYYLGMIACQQGRFAEGAERARHALATDPKHLLAHVLLGRALAAAGRQEEALVSFDRALLLTSDMAQIHGHRADVLTDLARYEEAVDSYDRALSLNSKDAENWLNRGAALAILNRNEEAIRSFEWAISCKPQLVEAHLRRAKTLSDIERDQEGLESVDKAIAITPRLAQAWLGRGNILVKLKKYDDAFAAFDQALGLDPNLGAAWLGRGNALAALRRYDDALAAYDQALSMSTDLPEAWLGRGNTFVQLRRYEDAVSAYDRALGLDRRLSAAWFGRGNVMYALKRHAEAAEAFTVLLENDPHYPFAKGMLLHQKMLMCDWRGLDELVIEIECDVAAGRPSAEPFGWQAASHSPCSLHACAALFCAKRFPADGAIDARRSSSQQKKIRIAYLSDALRQQATLSLLVGAMELYDRSRFEFFGFDNSGDDGTEMRRRIAASMQEMVDVTALDDRSVAAAIREREIDILVHLNGWFGDGRTGVFALRPAPIQVNYLGFPATMGTSYIDYIIADRLVIPAGHEKFYSEKIVYLPDCYQPNDRKRTISTLRGLRDSR